MSKWESQDLSLRPSCAAVPTSFFVRNGAKTLLFMALVKAVSAVLGGCRCGLFWPLVNDVRKREARISTSATLETVLRQLIATKDNKNAPFLRKTYWFLIPEGNLLLSILYVIVSKIL